MPWKRTILKDFFMPIFLFSWICIIVNLLMLFLDKICKYSLMFIVFIAWLIRHTAGLTLSKQFHFKLARPLQITMFILTSQNSSMRCKNLYMKNEHWDQLKLNDKKNPKLIDNGNYKLNYILTKRVTWPRARIPSVQKFKVLWLKLFALHI